MSTVSMRRRLTAVRKKLPQNDIENDPYDIGYWERHANLPRPDDSESRAGWDDANNELLPDTEDASGSVSPVGQEEKA